MSAVGVSGTYWANSLWEFFLVHHYYDFPLILISAQPLIKMIGTKEKSMHHQRGI